MNKEHPRSIDTPPKPITRTQSISKGLTFGLVLTIVVVASITIASIYFQSLQRQNRALAEKAEEFQSYLIGSLGVPLWNLDIRTIKVIGESFSQNELIVKLRIVDHLGNKIYAIEKEHGSDLIQRTGQIFHNGKIIGAVEFFLTKRYHREDNQRLLLFYSMSFLAVIFVLILVTGLLVRRFLNRPLQRLNETVDAYSNGAYDFVSTRLPYLEFIPFEDVLSNMGDKIQSQMNELNKAMSALRKAHDEMEAKVVARTAELMEAKESAEAANRAKTTFISTMSHELRTPLNAIFGFSQLIARSPSLPPEHQEHIELINRSGEHLLSLINHVLDMSKIEAGRTTIENIAFDLGRLIDEVSQSFRLKSLGKGLDFETYVSSTVPQYVTGDAVKIRQVLINLLSNAIKYTDQGKVSLRVDAKEAPEAKIPDYQRLSISVEDSGPGIPDDELDQVFEAFVQAHSGKLRQGGTGLGLALSKEFVELMGGELIVHSRVGHGSVFHFEIPVRPAIAEHVRYGDEVPRVVGLAPGQPRYRILVVDDEKSSRRLMTDTLTQISSGRSDEPGFDVRQAANGREALKIWQSWKPHLIWMDVRMPDMDGLEAARRIKLEAPDTSTVVIGLSASAFEDQRSTVLAAGCDDYMPKPVRLHDIFKMMQKYIGVRYIYSNPTSDDTKAESTLVQMPIILETLPHVSKPLQADLLDAADETNPKKAQYIIQQIAKDHPILAAELVKLVDSFRFDELREVIGGAHDG